MGCKLRGIVPRQRWLSCRCFASASACSAAEASLAMPAWRRAWSAGGWASAVTYGHSRYSTRLQPLLHADAALTTRSPLLAPDGTQPSIIRRTAYSEP